MLRKYLNIPLSILFALTSIFVFLVLQVIAVAAPLGFGFLPLYLMSKFAPDNHEARLYIIAFGGLVGSVLTFVNLLRGVGKAIGTPERENLTEN